MDASNPALSAQTLLEHEGFVRSVARGLLRDEHAAEDVAQDTWLTALGRLPGAPQALRGWLGSVARNRARDVRRRTLRRDVRERAAARAEAVPAVDQAFERLSVQRDVVSAILELDEPYRSVVILRYYHDLEPVEIARRLKANPASVRTQLVRAHEHLRRKLDARHGRETWAALLLSGAGRSAWTGTAAKAALLCAGLAGSAGVVWWAVRPPEHSASFSVAAASVGPAERSSTPAAIEPTSTTTAEPPVAQREPVLGERAEEQVPVTDRIFVERAARAELIDREDRGGYGKSVFSFEHGLRDDPQNAVTRNDWDVCFDRNDFDVKTVVDDQSIIIDLGVGRLADVTAGPLTRQIVEATALFYALADEKQKDEKQRVESAEALLHHTYFVWTRDSDSNLVSAFEVVELQPGERCVLDWFSTRDGRFARASAELARPELLARTLFEFRTLFKQPRSLGSPRAALQGTSVVLQGRNGAGGGNAFRVNLAGEMHRFDRRSETPLDLVKPSDMHEDSVVYVEHGGFIPDENVFVVQRVTWSGAAAGDSNGSGGFRVVLKDLVLAEREIRPSGIGGGETGPEEPIQGVWAGRVELRPGDEKLVYLELRNSSKGEVVFQGSLEPRPRATEPGASTAVASAATDPEPVSAGSAAAESIFVERSPRAELFELEKGSEGYGRSVFSFEHGLRDDPEKEVTRDDWDIQFRGIHFDVKTIVNDRSLIVDLGPGRLADVRANDVTRQLVQAAGLLRRTQGEYRKAELAEAQRGHCYFVWTRDPDSDVVSAFEVLELEPNARCLLEWFSTRGGRFVRASADVARPELLSQALLELRSELRSKFSVQGPRVVLQARTGERAAGNRQKVNLVGELQRFDDLSSEPLDLHAPAPDDESIAHVEGAGFIPEDQVFVVTEARWFGVAGNANRDGGFKVVLKDLLLAEHERTPEPVRGEWSGRVELQPGDEDVVYLELRNASRGEVVFQGSLEPRPR